MTLAHMDTGSVIVSADNSIHTYHQNLGYDTHYEIDGWWSQDGGWISWNSMVEAADSSFVFM